MAQDKATQGITELNALEQRIARDEEVRSSAGAAIEDARWHQAQIVVEMLDAGATQKQIAAGWTNARTGKPYAHQHVSFCKLVWQRWGSSELERPDWTTAYYTVQQGSDEIVPPDDRRQQWSDAHEARTPKSQASAEKFVENLQDAPPEVIDTIARGAREVSENRYLSPKERNRRRKEADAYADEVGQPVRDEFSKLAVILHLEQALDELRDMNSIGGNVRTQIMGLLAVIEQEAEIKAAMERVR